MMRVTRNHTVLTCSHESEVSVMEIFIVMEPGMSGNHGSYIHEVFDTMEKAEQYIKDYDVDDYDIEDLKWYVVTRVLK